MSLIRWFDKHPVTQCVSISIVLNLLVEMLSRRSMIAGFEFLLTNPLLFLYNAAIILLTLSISVACKRRYFFLLFVSVVWLGLGIANCVILGFRTTPLAAIDFRILSSVASIIYKYLTLANVLLITVSAFVVVVGIIVAWKNTPRRKPRYGMAISAITAIAVIIVFSTSLFSRTQAASGFGNLADAYKEYGFVYCFSRSLVDQGIDKPDNYSEEAVYDVLRAVNAYHNQEPKIKPNIILVELESFFDVNYLKGLSFSRNPVPAFTALKAHYPHGFLTVPSIGAGTANTEFEILSGMDLSFFGAGEYPYKTVLRDETCESICYNLAEVGYTNHAIHNHEGTFYQRHVVFSHLGFNTFTSLEYMNDVKFTPNGWAKDDVLTEQVVKALNSTPGQDFVFTISVQAHGRYPQEATEDHQEIKVYGFEDEKKLVAFEYFVNQIYETDAFIDALVSALEDYPEPVILVFYGDHLPSFDIENEDLVNGNRFQTEYVIWSNFDLEVPNNDIYAYQLGAYILEQCGISNGIMTKLHQQLRHKEYYREALELIEYDLVCGEQIAYNGVSPHLPTLLQMGTSPIRITGIDRGAEHSLVNGIGFSPWSYVLVDGDKVETTFIDENTLMITEELEPGATIVVAQMVAEKTILSRTDEYRCP
ncbi:MAG: LTA synthase family protein [Bacillota bacterium]|jgi:phosphoglycerol transferase MdoB-like AlkP superfamily enzyme